jgi:hypothetical protein
LNLYILCKLNFLNLNQFVSVPFVRDLMSQVRNSFIILVFYFILFYFLWLSVWSFRVKLVAYGSYPHNTRLSENIDMKQLGCQWVGSDRVRIGSYYFIIFFCSDPNSIRLISVQTILTHTRSDRVTGRSDPCKIINYLLFFNIILSN